MRERRRREGGREGGREGRRVGRDKRELSLNQGLFFTVALKAGSHMIHQIIFPPIIIISGCMVEPTSIANNFSILAIKLGSVLLILKGNAMHHYCELNQPSDCECVAELTLVGVNL